VVGAGTSPGVAAAYLKVRLLQLVRIPAFVVPTLGFPGLFFYFFSLSRGSGQGTSSETLTGFAVFAVLGVAFFQFGVGIAADRAMPWERFLRTLPADALPRIAAQLIAAFAFGSVAVFIVVLVAAAGSDVGIAGSQWVAWSLSLALGAVPFALFGIALGYWADPRGALPIANVIYLPLSYVGGLWTPVEALPDTLRQISRFLPTRHFADVVLAVTGDGPLPVASWCWLAAFGVVCLAFALWGYWREEALRFR
jgi:ABC-2 type transport system permease protein